MRLETERLVLREPRLEDARAFDEFWQDEEASRFVGGVKSPQEVDEMMKRSHQALGVVRNRELHGRAPRRRRGSRAASASWSGTRRRGRTATASRSASLDETELGWKLDRRAWGNGYASEAAIACRDWALGALGLTRLISLIALENTASIRVAERIGESFERELEPSPFSHPAGMWSLGERMAP